MFLPIRNRTINDRSRHFFTSYDTSSRAETRSIAELRSLASAAFLEWFATFRVIPTTTESRSIMIRLAPCFNFATEDVMKRTDSGIGALVGLFAASCVHALTINFDTAPDGGPVASGTPVNMLYASQGVTFSRTATEIFSSCFDALGRVYANADRPADFTLSSSPNVVSICRPPRASDISESSFGAIRADFARPASQVCINVRPDGGPNTAVLRGYDASASLLTSATSTAGAIEKLCVTAPGIRRVEFSGAGIGSARFDDLVITFAGAAPAPVPDVSALALLALIVTVLTLGLHRARRR